MCVCACASERYCTHATYLVGAAELHDEGDHGVGAGRAQLLLELAEVAQRGLHAPVLPQHVNQQLIVGARGRDAPAAAVNETIETSNNKRRGTHHLRFISSKKTTASVVRWCAWHSSSSCRSVWSLGRTCEQINTSGTAIPTHVHGAHLHANHLHVVVEALLVREAAVGRVDQVVEGVGGGRHPRREHVPEVLLRLQAGLM